MRIKEISGDEAVAEAGGVSRAVYLGLIKDPRVGEYVLAHGDLAINKVPEDEALKIAEMIKELPHGH